MLILSTGSEPTDIKNGSRSSDLAGSIFQCDILNGWSGSDSWRGSQGEVGHLKSWNLVNAIFHKISLILVIIYGNVIYFIPQLDSIQNLWRLITGKITLITLKCKIVQKLLIRTILWDSLFVYATNVTQIWTG